MKFRYVAVLILTALVITSGATAAMVAQGGNPLNAASGSQHSSHNHADEGAINVSVAGNVTPGNNVVLTGTLDGAPVRFAAVTVNGQDVGETDANGSIAVTVPDADEFEVEIEADSKGELSIPLDEESETDEDDREEERDESDEADDDDEGDEGDALNITIDGNVTPGSNVTIVVTQEGYPVAGATVTVNGEPVGETDTNGTVTATVPNADGDEFEVEAEFDEEGKMKLPLEEDEGKDTIKDEEEDDDEDEELDEDNEGQIDLIVKGTLEPGENLSVTAMQDGNPVSNATVTVNGETVGQTDANGSITVQVPDADELEIEVGSDDREAELTVAFEDAEDDDHDSDDEEKTEDDEEDNEED